MHFISYPYTVPITCEYCKNPTSPEPTSSTMGKSQSEFICLDIGGKKIDLDSIPESIDLSENFEWDHTDTDNNNNNNNNKCKYLLYAIIVHHGKKSIDHYVTYIQNVKSTTNMGTGMDTGTDTAGTNWRLYDDKNVKEYVLWTDLEKIAKGKVENETEKKACALFYCLENKLNEYCNIKNEGLTNFGKTCKL